ncbi:hypothetical protein E7Z59_14475 [Robertkochia marina]|uniref:Uncharacterized protein n=1 Tax=Robertkochia marina TaxID=1227945 RepID=A0A4S3LZS6_9FLAO|nr:hypothetical protein [Robertkochia marina]THD65789.1 hypothetical protein E7Z59_14475 [Robertkochia marina]TRZ46526.1 hypothetical protein D3A96_02870 [Robertkochia marina]
MYKTLEYLKYLYRSTNQHGVHSPFVFQWVTQAMYGKQEQDVHPVLKELKTLNDLKRKDLKALNRSLYHLYGDRCPQIILPGITAKAPEQTNRLVFIDLTKGAPPPQPEALVRILDNDTLVLIRKTGVPSFWRALTTHPEVHLTIDCYHIGYALKRKEQVKENFTIRL